MENNFIVLSFANITANIAKEGLIFQLKQNAFTEEE